MNTYLRKGKNQS